MGYQLSTSSKYNRQGVDQRLIDISDFALRISLVDFGHGQDSGKRTAKRQSELFDDEKSACDGYDKISNHQTGEALDFYAFVDGKASWKHEHLAMVAAAFLQAASILGYPVKWGGLWRSKKSKIYGWDMPHIELMGD